MSQNEYKGVFGMDKETIGSRIEKLRKAKNLTQAELGKALFVNRITINQWENGTRDLKTDYTIKLADYFSVSCDELLRGIRSENISIHEKTGLSDIAVSRLNDYAKRPAIKGINDNLFMIDFINELLENKRLFYIIRIMGKAFIEKKNLELSKMYISPSLSSNMDSVNLQYWKLQHTTNEWITSTMKTFYIDSSPTLEKIIIEKIESDEYDWIATIEDYENNLADSINEDILFDEIEE